MENLVTNGYLFDSVILLETHFERLPQITLDLSKTNQKIHIENEVQQNENKIFVILTLHFDIFNNETIEVKSKIKMVGIFEKIGTPKLEQDIFVRLNAPAMLFPYLREHLTNLSVKAGLPPIIVQPINFENISQKN